MGRLNITHLQCQALAAGNCTATGQKGIETEADAVAEDRKRARLAEKAAGLANRPENRSAALGLASKLNYAARGEGPPASIASAAHMLHHRQCIGAAMKDVFSDGDPRTPFDPASSATILRQDFELSVGDLIERHPKQFLNPLRMDLYRCGAGTADGALFLGLHGEFEPVTKTARVHFHGLASREMIGVVERLRQLPAYRPIKRRFGTVHKSVPSVRMCRLRADDTVGPFTYPVQSFWPSRWEGLIDGKISRQRSKSRISEPEHSRILLWLDQWSLSDLTLLLGLRVTKDGLRETKRKS